MSKQAMVFQVIALRQIPNIQIGRHRVEFLYQSALNFEEINQPHWIGQPKMDSGFAKVVGLELTLLDSCRYFHSMGGIHAAI